MFIFQVIYNFIRRNVENAVRSPLAYLCVFLSVIGGIAAQNTFLAKIMTFPITALMWIVNLFTKEDVSASWIVYPLIALGAFAVAADFGREGIPERWAVYIPFVWPSLFRAIPKDSEWRADMLKWLNGINDWIWDHFGAKIGGGGQESVLTAIALTFIVVVIFYYEKFGAERNASVEASNRTSTPVSTSSGGRRRRRPA